MTRRPTYNSATPTSTPPPPPPQKPQPPCSPSLKQCGTIIQCLTDLNQWYYFQVKLRGAHIQYSWYILRMSWNGCRNACKLSASCYFNDNSESTTIGTSHVDFLHPVISRRSQKNMLCTYRKSRPSSAASNFY